MFVVGVKLTEVWLIPNLLLYAVITIHTFLCLYLVEALVQ
jgi:hypothetical protein